MNGTKWLSVLVGPSGQLPHIIVPSTSGESGGGFHGTISKEPNGPRCGLGSFGGESSVTRLILRGGGFDFQ